MILFIDTSLGTCYSAIYKDGKIIGEVNEYLKTKMSDIGTKLIFDLFDDNNLDIKDLDKVIVVTGPGSYTGVRIGVTTAKIIAYSLNIDLIPISKLELMAFNTESNLYKVPVIDARRDNYYSAVYDKDNKLVLKEAHRSIEDLLEFLKDKDYVFIYDDEIKLDKRLKFEIDFEKTIKHFMNYQKIDNIHLLDANYLKKTEAEENRDKL